MTNNIMRYHKLTTSSITMLYDVLHYDRNHVQNHEQPQHNHNLQQQLLNRGNLFGQSPNLHTSKTTNNHCITTTYHNNHSIGETSWIEPQFTLPQLQQRPQAHGTLVGTLFGDVSYVLFIHIVHYVPFASTSTSTFCYTTSFTSHSTSSSTTTTTTSCFHLLR